MSDAWSLQYRPRVLLADDHVVMAEALQSLLCTHCDIAGIVSDGNALVAKAIELSPDLIVLDIAMPVLNGIRAAQQIKKSMPEMRFVFLTIMEDSHSIAAALRLGPVGYVLKQQAASELMTAIRRVLSGRSFVTSRIRLRNSILGTERSHVCNELTPGQGDVIKLLAEGRLMKEIADILQVSQKTVEYRKYRVMKSFDLQSNADLVLFALDNGLLSSN
jgi:DNA-binding NarL/FixJ family response regulator